jgi:hypothetical protein
MNIYEYTVPKDEEKYTEIKYRQKLYLISSTLPELKLRFSNGATGNVSDRFGNTIPLQSK